METTPAGRTLVGGARCLAALATSALSRSIRLGPSTYGHYSHKARTAFPQRVDGSSAGRSAAGAGLDSWRSADLWIQHQRRPRWRSTRSTEHRSGLAELSTRSVRVSRASGTERGIATRGHQAITACSTRLPRCNGCSETSSASVAIRRRSPSLASRPVRGASTR